MATAHKWQPITDLAEDPQSLTDGELEPLHRVWLVQKEELSQAGLLDEFEQRLRREWAIETGIIEKVYELDRGVTRTLIEQGIDASLIPHGKSNPEGVIVAQTVQDHYDALDGIFDVVAGQRPLTTGYIKELHAALLRNQRSYHPVGPHGRVLEIPLEKGVYKRLPNSPTRNGSVHEYCPPEHVASEMDHLIQMYRAHQDRAVPPEVEAAWLHHRFTQVHPFADGNGRVARAIASLVFIKAGWFPLVVTRDDWPHYIEVLEKADQDDLRPLVGFFAGAQRSAVIQASEIGFDTRPPATTDEALHAIRDRILLRSRAPSYKWLSLKPIVEHLKAVALQRLSDLAASLNEELGQLSPGAEFAGKAFSDEEGYRHDLVVTLGAGHTDALTIDFKAEGAAETGICQVTGQLTWRGGNRVALGMPAFQVNYQETLSSAEARFKDWLEKTILDGLQRWRKTL